MQSSLIQPPAIDRIAEGGQLMFAANGELVLIGLKEGGLSIAGPVWMKTHYLQAFNMVGQFISQCSIQQAELLAAIMREAAKKH